MKFILINKIEYIIIELMQQHKNYTLKFCSKFHLYTTIIFYIIRFFELKMYISISTRNKTLNECKDDFMIWFTKKIVTSSSTILCFHNYFHFTQNVREITTSSFVTTFFSLIQLYVFLHHVWNKSFGLFYKGSCKNIACMKSRWLPAWHIIISIIMKMILVQNKIDNIKD